MKEKFKECGSTRLQISRPIDAKYSADHDASDPAWNTTAQGKSRTKSELLEQLAVVEIGLRKSLKLRPSKDTLNKLDLLEELKGRVEASPENTRISFDLYSPPIRTSCYLCVTQPNVEVSLEHQLTQAITSLGAEENNFNEEDTSSGSSSDTSCYGSGQETKSPMSYDNDEVIFVSQSDIQSDDNGRLEHQLTQAITSLGAEENNFNEEDTSSGSSSDTSSYGSSQETKSPMSHDNDEIILLSQSDIQSDDNGLIDICTSGTQRISTPAPERSMVVNRTIFTGKSGTRIGGILLRRTDYGNDTDDGCCTSDTKHERRSRSTRTVRFCDKSSEVRIIDAKPSFEDRLAKARSLVNNAKNSRETLVSVGT